jgi:hypothetical protein
VIQQGQVFKLKAKGREGQPLWRTATGSRARIGEAQVGGFATRAEGLKALEKVLARLGPGGRAATLTLGELVDEYLEMHQAEPVTLAKLRWLLGKATATFADLLRIRCVSEHEPNSWAEEPSLRPSASAISAAPIEPTATRTVASDFVPRTCPQNIRLGGLRSPIRLNTLFERSMQASTSVDPELPRKPSNLSPRPSPKTPALVACV